MANPIKRKLSLLPALLAGLSLAACSHTTQQEGDLDEAEIDVPSVASHRPMGYSAIKQAAAAGDKDSQYQMGVWYEDNHPESERDLVKAYAWYKLAVQQGDLGAHYALERFEAQLTDAERAKADALVGRWRPGDTLDD